MIQRQISALREITLISPLHKTAGRGPERRKDIAWTYARTGRRIRSFSRVVFEKELAAIEKDINGSRDVVQRRPWILPAAGSPITRGLNCGTRSCNGEEGGGQIGHALAIRNTK